MTKTKQINPKKTQTNPKKRKKEKPHNHCQEGEWICKIMSKICGNRDFYNLRHSTIRKFLWFWRLVQEGWVRTPPDIGGGGWGKSCPNHLTPRGEVGPPFHMPQNRRFPGPGRVGSSQIAGHLWDPKIDSSPPRVKNLWIRWVGVAKMLALVLTLHFCPNSCIHSGWNVCFWTNFFRTLEIWSCNICQFV